MRYRCSRLDSGYSQGLTARGIPARLRANGRAQPRQRIESRPLEPDPVETGEGRAACQISATLFRIPGKSTSMDRAGFACRCARLRCRAASRRCASTTRAGPRTMTSTTGLPKLREPWVRARRATGCVTQLHYARKGEITPEMEFIALREGLPAEFVRERGRARPRHHSRPTSTTSSSSR